MSVVEADSCRSPRQRASSGGAINQSPCVRRIDRPLVFDRVPGWLRLEGSRNRCRMPSHLSRTATRHLFSFPGDRRRRATLVRPPGWLPPDGLLTVTLFGYFSKFRSANPSASQALVQIAEIWSARSTFIPGQTARRRRPRAPPDIRPERVGSGFPACRASRRPSPRAQR